MGSRLPSLLRVHDVLGELLPHRLPVLVERARLELRSGVRGELRRDDLVGGLEELRQVVEDLGVLWRHEGDGEALVPCAARPPDSVCVVLDRLRHVEVEDHLHTLDVETTARDIRRNQDVIPALLEGSHRPLTLLLAFPAVDRADAVPAVVQGLRQDVHRLLLVDEDDDGRLLPDEQLLQPLLFLRLTDELQTLLDILLGVARVAYAHYGRASQECPRKSLDRRGHRRAKHLRDAESPVPGLGLQLLLVGLVLVCSLHIRAGDGQEDTSNIVLEPQVYHLVGLVDHDVVALVQHRVPLVQRVAEPPRRRKTALYALSQLEGLLLGVPPADDADHAAGAVLGELDRLLLDLQDQLAARREDDGVWPILRGCVVQRRKLLHVRKDRQHVGRCLPAPRLGDGDEVAVVAGDGDHLHLDRRGLGVPDLVYGLEELPSQRPFGPDAHRDGDATTPDVDLEILAEYAPVAHCHVAHRLVCPVGLMLVRALDVALLERQGLLRRLDEGRDVLAGVLGTLGDELFVKAVVFPLLTDIDACAVTASE
mmetsp:Transcript_93388/g.264373  ORF Transcript_93388/g.264373 Transcript_93388/m.264373 type:complete len:538 (+) Transcript_93388:218-1831(+)